GPGRRPFDSRSHHPDPKPLLSPHRPRPGAARSAENCYVEPVAASRSDAPVEPPTPSPDADDRLVRGPAHPLEVLARHEPRPGPRTPRPLGRQEGDRGGRYRGLHPPVVVRGTEGEAHPCGARPLPAAAHHRARSRRATPCRLPDARPLHALGRDLHRLSPRLPLP